MREPSSEQLTPGGKPWREIDSSSLAVFWYRAEVARACCGEPEERDRWLRDLVEQGREPAEVLAWAWYERAHRGVRAEVRRRLEEHSVRWPLFVALCYIHAPNEEVREGTTGGEAVTELAKLVHLPSPIYRMSVDDVPLVSVPGAVYETLSRDATFRGENILEILGEILNGRFDNLVSEAVACDLMNQTAKDGHGQWLMGVQSLVAERNAGASESDGLGRALRRSGREASTPEDVAIQKEICERLRSIESARISERVKRQRRADLRAEYGLSPRETRKPGSGGARRRRAKLRPQEPS
jgi:hypothetical protein